MRIFLSVGEPSGDLHGSNLIRRLKEKCPDTEFVGFGGPKMEAAGCRLIYDLTSMAIMFIGEAIRNLRFFFRLVDQADDYFANHQVDAVVLIDYPGFNWWIAKKAKKRGIPVFYYGVPQMWAWAPWRVRKIRKYVDHVLCKLPFEVEWFEKRNCQATYVGHPYFDQLAKQSYDEDFLANIQQETAPLVVLLPGSRNQEVRNVLPTLLETANQIQAEKPECRIAIAAYSQEQANYASEMVREQELAVTVYCGRTPELMKSSTMCLACSGSVSLELMQHRKPTLIVYRVKRWVMAAQAILLRSKFITLVNLIHTRDIRKRTWGPFDPDANGAETVPMPEYLSVHSPASKMANRALRLLGDPIEYESHVAMLDELAVKFAKPGATARAADYIIKKLVPESDENSGDGNSYGKLPLSLSNRKSVA